MQLMREFVLPVLLVMASLAAVVGMLASFELLAVLLRPLRLAPLLRSVGRTFAAWTAFGLLLAALFTHQP